MWCKVLEAERNEAQGNGPAKEKMAGIEQHSDDAQYKVSAGDPQSLAQRDQLFFSQPFFHGRLYTQEDKIAECGCVGSCLITKMQDAYII